MDRLNAMRLFVRLVECGSFSAVAREEGTGQPAVSKQISALEQYLGAQLLLRTSRKMTVTDAGQALYESAKPLLDDFEALESSLGHRQRSPQGVVRMTTAPVFGRLYVMPLLPAFFQRYPEVSVELSVSERHIDMIGEGVDLAIRHGHLADSSLTAKTLFHTGLVLVASTVYLKERGLPVRIGDLDNHTCIVSMPRLGRRPWNLRDEERGAISYIPQGPLLLPDAEHIRQAVISGFGIAQVPIWLVADVIRTGEVQVVLPECQQDSMPVSLVYPAGRRLPMKARVLVDYLVSMLPPTDEI